MITFISGALITLAAFAGAFVSGVFGMVGGQILLAVLLYYLPVAAAMTLFSAMMFVTGVWRSVLWWRHIHWPVAIRYIAGAIMAYAIMLLIVFIPSKPMVYLGIGVLPLLGDLVPKKFAPDITRRGMAWFCGFIIMTLQIAVGAAGNVLDMFFQASPLSRHVIVATKAIAQLISQVMRFIYFGLLLGDANEFAPWWFFIVMIIVSLAGTSAGGAIMNGMSETNFRRGTRYLIWILSVIYIARGLWLLLFD